MLSIIVQRRGKVLLTKRAIIPAKGQWHIPGGTVLMGERLIDTAKRAAKEELGIKVKIKKILGVIEYPSFKKDYYGQNIGIAFLASPITENIKIDNNADEYSFFNVIPKNTIIEQKKFLNKYLKLKTGNKKI